MTVPRIRTVASCQTSLPVQTTPPLQVHAPPSKAESRSFRCLFFCLLLLLVTAAVAIYLVFDPKPPEYAVTGVAIGRMNVTSSAPISPEFNITVRAKNPSRKVRIYYAQGGAVTVLYDGVELGSGVLPALDQPWKNVTVLTASLRGYDVVLEGAALRNAVRRRRVPLSVNVDVAYRFMVGSAKAWKMTANVTCVVVVDALDDGAHIRSSVCYYSLKFW